MWIKDQFGKLVNLNNVKVISVASDVLGTKVMADDTTLFEYKCGCPEYQHDCAMEAMQHLYDALVQHGEDFIR